MNPSDIEALRTFYVETRQELYTYALSITGSREAAEDVNQSVFAKLLGRQSLPAGLRPYVFRSVRNAAYDAWRSTKVRADSIFAAAESLAPAPSGAPGADELEPLLRQLSADERESIVLKIYGGLTFQEIADLREVPLPTVASWYRRGLQQLRTLLNTDVQ